jgi:hypothetical protein
VLDVGILVPAVVFRGCGTLGAWTWRFWCGSCAVSAWPSQPILRAFSSQHAGFVLFGLSVVSADRSVHRELVTGGVGRSRGIGRLVSWAFRVNLITSGPRLVLGPFALFWHRVWGSVRPFYLGGVFWRVLGRNVLGVFGISALLAFLLWWLWYLGGS